MTARPPLLSVSLLSAATLAYEILLMRLFSIIQWHHFAYMIIALALLGYGISGTLLSILRHRLIHRYATVYLGLVLLFAVSSLISFLLAQTIPFNMEELLWNPRQIANLSLLFLLLTLPFVFAAAAICLTFMAFSEQNVSRTYTVDLLGAGLGSLGTIGLMYLLMPEQILPVISLIAVTAAAVAIRDLRIERTAMAYGGLSLIALIFLAVTPQLELIYSPYKGLSQSLQVKGARVVEQRASPLGHLTVVANDEVPLRHVPGLSLTASMLPPSQLALFIDADNLTAITSYSGSIDSFAYLDQTTSALAYHLTQPNRLLVIGSGTGNDLLQAMYHQVSRIDALELNPQVVDIVNRDAGRFSGLVYRTPQTELHIAEAREFLSATDNSYDLIQIALTDAAGASSSGLYALNESYLYTKEAMKLFLSHLNPQGYLSVTRWIKMPPRDTLKLFATFVEVLRESGLSEIDKRLVLIRSWQTSTLLIKNGLFTAAELKAVENFCNGRLFDLAYLHDLDADKVNRFNILKQPYFFDTAQQMVKGDLESVYSDYKFDIRPATDDRPYFHHFFKWGSFIEAFGMRNQGGMPLIEWGYVVLIVTLLLSGILSSLLILLPLLLFRNQSGDEQAITIRKLPVVLYFFGVGLAFLFIEIAFIQKFLSFLHHPIYAIAVTLTAFLIFAGLGSLSSQRLSDNYGYRRTLGIAIVSIAMISLGYLLILDPIFNAFVSVAMTTKLVISLLLIAPLAFAMGMPFPLALSVLKRGGEPLLPWAWGINGYASVISAILATLIAIHLGFQVVVLSAVAIYLLLLYVFPERHRLEQE